LKRVLEKLRPDIVSVHLSPEAKAKLDDVCFRRGMTIKRLLGRLIEWFVELDRTEQSIVLGLVEEDDIKGLAQMILSRRPDRAMPEAAPPPPRRKSKGRRGRPPQSGRNQGSSD
jgi:hypothetical protein